MKRHLPTLLFLIILLSFSSVALLFLLHHGPGKTLRLAGYIFLGASLLSFLFFLSIDPGYGWVKPANPQKNQVVLSAFLALFILSIGLIVLGQRMSESHTRSLGNERATEQVKQDLSKQ